MGVYTHRFIVRTVLALASVLVFLLSPVFSQTTVFIETMGSGGANGASIATWESNNYFDNDAFTMTGTGDMRNNNVSSGYTGASGTWNVMLNASTEYFQIEGVNTTVYLNLFLSFGIRKGTTAENGSGISIQVSSDGTTWTALTMPALPTGTGTATWYYRTCSGSIPSTSNLRIRFTSSNAVEWRLDDILLTDGTSSNVIHVDATGGTLYSADYPNLKTAFDNINNGVHQGNIEISVYGNSTETIPAVLNESGGSASYTYVHIQPTGGVARTITGAIAGGSPLIDFNGADNVIINGLNSSGNSLIIANTTASATTGTCTIKFRNDASNNTITNCSVLGSSTANTGVSCGNIIFGAESSSTGNSNNNISYCDIGPAGTNFNSKAIHFGGTLTSNNTNNTISNNNIFDYYNATTSSAGIYVDNNTTACDFLNNRFYQTSSRNYPANIHSAIYIANSNGNDFLIQGNIIGYSNSANSGVYQVIGTGGSPGTQFIPIYLNVGTTSTTIVQGNTISNIAISGSCYGTSASSPFIGIYNNFGLVNITDNLIGSMTSTNSITFTTSTSTIGQCHINGIYSRGNNNWTTNDNSIGGISVNHTGSGSCQIYCLRGQTGTGYWTCNNNTIGGSIPNYIQNQSANSDSYIAGLYNSSYTGNVTGNIIRNISSAASGNVGSMSVIGFYIGGGAPNQIISQNQINNCSTTNNNSTAITTVIGISVNGSGTNLIERNFIHSLSNVSSSTSATINGIRASNGTTTYQNNIISLSSSTSGASEYGFNDIGGTNNLYLNSVSLTGTSTSGAQDAAFSS